MNQNDEGGVDSRLIEYEELAQSSNDASAISMRHSIMKEHLQKIMEVKTIT